MTVKRTKNSFRLSIKHRLYWKVNNFMTKICFPCVYHRCHLVFYLSDVILYKIILIFILHVNAQITRVSTFARNVSSSFHGALLLQKLYFLVTKILIICLKGKISLQDINFSTTIGFYDIKDILASSQKSFKVYS